MDPSSLSSPQMQQFLNFSSEVYTIYHNEVGKYCSKPQDRLCRAVDMRLYKQEKERAMLNEMVSKLTIKCWDKCITGTPGSKFSSSETACLSNCAQRYMDMSLIIMKRFQSMQ